MPFVPKGCKAERYHNQVGDSRLSGSYFATPCRSSCCVALGSHIIRSPAMSVLFRHIKGAWPLYDRLCLKSESGHIYVYIEPKETLPGRAKRAELELTTTSGNIRVSEPIQDEHQDLVRPMQQGDATVLKKLQDTIPSRDYQVVLETDLGSIKGKLAFTSSAKFNSISGPLDVILLPFIPDIRIASPQQVDVVDTSTKSGKTVVQVMDPVWARNGKRNLREMRSCHESTSAPLTLRYPASWQGYIEIKPEGRVIHPTGNILEFIKTERIRAVPRDHWIRWSESYGTSLSTMWIEGISDGITLAFAD